MADAMALQGVRWVMCCNAVQLYVEVVLLCSSLVACVYDGGGEGLKRPMKRTARSTLALWALCDPPPSTLPARVPSPLFTRPPKENKKHDKPLPARPRNNPTTAVAFFS